MTFPDPIRGSKWVSAGLCRGRLPGVGKIPEEKLAKLELKTVGEPRGLDESALEDEFGRCGVRLYELARGIDESPVVPDRPTSPYPSRIQFKRMCCWQ